jgi:hypothetical protein
MRHRPRRSGGGGKNDGVVITLGPIPEGENRVEVQASLYAGPLAGTWLTYVVGSQARGGASPEPRARWRSATAEQAD